MRRARAAIVSLAGLGVLLAVVPAMAASDHARPQATAVIRRTAHGIPHIEASSYAGLGYGYGYAFAQDNLCTMAEDYVTVDAQRARYFGPNGSYEQRGNAITVNNLNSDVFWQSLTDAHVVDRLVAQAPPKGPEPELRDLMRGYAAGYDRYLRNVGGSAGVPDPTCRGKPWVRPISEMDAWRRLYQLILLASSDIAIDGIASDQPPTSSLPVSSLPSALG